MQLLGSKLRLGLQSTAMIGLDMPLAGRIAQQRGAVSSVIQCIQLSKLQTYSIWKTGIHLSCCMSNVQRTVASIAFDTSGMPMKGETPGEGRKSFQTCYWQEQPSTAAPICNRNRQQNTQKLPSLPSSQTHSLVAYIKVQPQ